MSETLHCVQCGSPHPTDAPCIYPDRCECGQIMVSMRPGHGNPKRCAATVECRRKTSLEGAKKRKEARP